MNFISFFAFRGTQVENGAYDRFNNKFFATDQVVTGDDCSYQFNGVVTSETIKKINGLEVSERLLDSTVVVTSVTNEQRQQNLAFWRNKKLQVLTAVILAQLTGLLAMIATNPGLLTASAIVTNPIALAAISISLLGLTLLGTLRFFQTRAQIKAWQEDPIASCQKIRKQAGMEGFLFIQKHGLKGTLVHPNEVKTAYWKWAEEFFVKFNKKKLTSYRIKKFFNQNPLDITMLEYADVKQDEQSRYLVQAFYQIKQRYSSIGAPMNDQQQKVNRQKEDLLQKNLLDYENSIRPINLTLNLLIQRAAENRDAIISVEGDDHQAAVARIERSYLNIIELNPKDKESAEDIKKTELEHARQDLARNQKILAANQQFTVLTDQYRFYYNKIIAPIHQLFYDKQTEIRIFAERQTAQIKTDENCQVSDLCPLIKALINANLNHPCSQSDAELLDNEVIRQPKLIDTATEYKLPPFDARWEEMGMNRSTYAAFIQQLSACLYS